MVGRGASRGTRLVSLPGMETMSGGQGDSTVGIRLFILGGGGVGSSWWAGVQAEVRGLCPCPAWRQ